MSSRTYRTYFCLQCWAETVWYQMFYHPMTGLQMKEMTYRCTKCGKWINLSGK